MNVKYLKTPLKLVFLITWTIIRLSFENCRQNLLNFTINSVIYIMGTPLGIKQSYVVKSTLGSSYLTLLAQTNPQDITTSLRICCYLTFAVYKYTFNTLKEIFHLLNNKTYNPVMKRFDVFYLSNDQIIMAGLLFSILSILYLNILLFYVYFTFIYLILETFKVLEKIIVDFCLSDLTISYCIRSNVTKY